MTSDTIKTAEKLAEKIAEMPGHGQSYAAFVRGQSYATADWSAADAAGCWIAWGWIEQDESPDDDTLASYLDAGLTITREDIAAVEWLAGQAGTDSESFVDEAVAAAKDCWECHWLEVEEDRNRQSALDEECDDKGDDGCGIADDDSDDDGDDDGPEFALERIALSDMGKPDLVAEIESMDQEDRDSAEAYRFVTYGEDGYEDGGGVVLFVGRAGRAGVCMNGDSSWTDADDAAGAVSRYLTGDMIE